jgi:uncharacterized protein YraI
MKKWKMYTGIVLILAVALFLGWNIQTGKAANIAATINTKSANGNVNVRTGPSTTSAMVKYNGADVKVPNGTSVTITSSMTGSDGKPTWYNISFVYNNATLTGWASADYVKVNEAETTPPSTNPNGSSPSQYKTVTKTIPISAAAKTLSNVYIRKTAGGAYYKVSGKKVLLKKKTAVTVKGQKTVKGIVWYQVSFTYKKVKRTGYIQSDYVKLTCKPNVNAKVYNVKNYLCVYSSVGKKNKVYKVKGKTVVVGKNQSVKILSDTKVKGKKWYYISFSHHGVMRKGYVMARYVTLVSTKTTVKVYAALSNAEFETYMTNEGFPESYKPRLRQLHEAHPYWRFTAYHTSMTWDTAVANESKLGLNLIGSYKSDAWKSQEPGAFDSTGDYKAFDGSKTNFYYWVAAGPNAVKYYMDPRNSLTEAAIFQFELLQYKSDYQTKDGVNTILSTTPFYGKSFQYTSGSTKKTISYTNAFMDAAKKSGVSPYHLVSRMRQEVVTSVTTTSAAVTGTNSQYKGIYNFYNIGASHGTNPTLNGLKWASTGTTYLRPWTDRYRSIVGGGMFIGENYINKGQNTIYLEKFNVTNTKPYTHQYMANVEAAYSEAAKTKKAYSGAMDKQSLVFSIPVYKNMPSETAILPLG